MTMMSYQGLPIIVENPRGSVRHWYDPAVGKHGKTVMQHSYGYVEGTMGTDGDEVDVYIGPNARATHVYIVTQMKPPDFKQVDEQKCMLGFSSEFQAKDAYIAHYNNPKFFGSMTTVSMDAFKEKLKSCKGSLIKALNAMTGSATLSDTTLMRSSMSNHSDALSLLKSVTATLEKACGENNVVDPKAKEKDLVLPEDEVAKGLKAAAVLGMSRQARLHAYGAAQMNEGEGVGTIRVRGSHEPPVVPVRRIETPVQAIGPVGTPETFASCGGCGLIHKSAQPCPRCEHAHSITPGLPAWRR